MLNGIDPIIIFQFEKLTDSASETLSKIPLFDKLVSKIGLPPIPIYLSETLTGLYIDSEDKSIEIETSTETLHDGEDPIITQKALNSTVKINMKASSDSIGLTLLSAMCDLILPKVTSQEYSITYLHGATTIFGGLLHSFNVQQTEGTDLLMVSLELTKSSTKTQKKPGPPEVTPSSEAISLNSGISPTAASPVGPTAPLRGVPLKGPLPPGTAPATPGLPFPQVPIKVKGLG
jgi:hypothetical protein